MEQWEVAEGHESVRFRQSRDLGIGNVYKLERNEGNIERKKEWGVGLQGSKE